MIQNKIIITANVDLNLVDGCVIWLSNLINTLGQKSIYVDYLNVYPMKNENFIRNIIEKKYLKIIDFDNVEDVIEYINIEYILDKTIDKIIVRSDKLIGLINNNYLPLEKMVVYGLDQFINNIKKLDNNFLELWTQSIKLQNFFISKGINKDKIKITPPICWKYSFSELKKKNDKFITIIYAGTIRDEENIIEIINEFKIMSQTTNIILKIVYGKIHGDKNFTNKIKNIIDENNPKIIFMNNLSHYDSCYQIATSDIGICWRKNGWGTNGEISTKMLEYNKYGLIICDNIESLKTLISNLTT